LQQKVSLERTAGEALVDGAVGEARPNPDQEQEQTATLQPPADLAPSTPVQLGSAAGQSRLLLDRETLFVTLDGIRHGPLEPQSFCIFQALHDAPRGAKVPSTELQKLPGCKGDQKQISRYLDRLPKPLRACIKGQSGSGRWLQLPPKK